MWLSGMQMHLKGDRMNFDKDLSGLELRDGGFHQCDAVETVHLQ